MIDINKMRRLALDGDLAAMQEIILRLEAAESECLEQARLNGMGGEREAALMAKLEAAEKDVALKEEVIDSLAAVVKRLNAQCDAAEKEREMDEERIADLMADLNRVGHEIDALRAKITEMEKQEPVAWMHETRRDSDVVTDAVKHVWGKVAVGSMAAYSIPLYALPDAQTQPAPSVPDDWLRAIDEALVVAHVGVANESDTYEQAKAKLDSLLGFHVDAATDPAVNGGWKLVPRPPTPTMVKAGLESSHVLNVHRVLACYDAMIDAAPEVKP